jgi:hypothetical protein
MRELEKIKFRIGDIVTPDPEQVFNGSWLADHVGKTAIVESFGLESMFSIRWLDNDWKVTMSNEKYILAEK